MYWKVMHQCPIVELKHVGLQLSISTKSSHCKHNHTHCPDGYESWKSLAPCPQMHNINCSQCKFWHTTHQTPLLPDDLVVGPLKSIWRLLARHWCLLCRWDPPKHHRFHGILHLFGVYGLWNGTSNHLDGYRLSTLWPYHVQQCQWCMVVDHLVVVYYQGWCWQWGL